MANPEHLEIFKSGFRRWNKWVNGNIKEAKAKFPYIDDFDVLRYQLAPDYLNSITPDLSNSDLSGERNIQHFIFDYANLQAVKINNTGINDCSFYRTDLKKSQITHSWVRSCSFTLCDMKKIDLEDSHFLNTLIGGCVLFEANLEKTEFSHSTFNSSILQKTDFHGSSLYSAIFMNSDLSDCIGLDSIDYSSHPILDFSTLYKSKLPNQFLVRCGAPDSFIEHYETVDKMAIEYYTCFISYSSIDEEFVNKLYRDLQNENVRCWYAAEDLKIGTKFRTSIFESIRTYDKVLIVFSKNSIDSDWVESEVEEAFSKERRTKQTVLFPIMIDDEIMKTDKAWAAEIRNTRHIGNFALWKEYDEYGKSFQRLLRDLNINSTQK